MMKQYNTCVTCETKFCVKDKAKPNKFCSVECYKTHRSNNKAVVENKPKEPTIKHSVVCGVEFTPAHPNVKTCSDACMKSKVYIHPNNNKICITCNTQYNNRNKNSRFCSRKCYWDFRNKNPNIQIQSNQLAKCKINKICNHCSRPYKVWNYRNDSTSFCSIKCHKEHRHILNKCPTCKTEFTSPKHVGKKYCSLECANKGIGKRKSKFAIATGLELSKLNIIHNTEHPIKTQTHRYTVDFIIDNKYIIECYGDYWHCNPLKYHGEYFHKQIRKSAYDIWEFDKNRMNELRSIGYITIFIWESDWYKNANYALILQSKLKEIGYEIQKNKNN